jgi:hypothetical protein
MTRVDIAADLNSEDETGFVWTFLDEADDPSIVWCHGCRCRAVGHGRTRTQVRDLPVAGVPTVLVFARRGGAAARRCARLQRGPNTSRDRRASILW